MFPWMKSEDRNFKQDARNFDLNNVNKWDINYEKEKQLGRKKKLSPKKLEDELKLLSNQEGGGARSKFEDLRKRKGLNIFKTAEGDNLSAHYPGIKNLTKFHSQELDSEEGEIKPTSYSSHKLRPNHKTYAHEIIHPQKLPPQISKKPSPFSPELQRGGGSTEAPIHASLPFNSPLFGYSEGEHRKKVFQNQYKNYIGAHQTHSNRMKNTQSLPNSYNQSDFVQSPFHNHQQQSSQNLLSHGSVSDLIHSNNAKYQRFLEMQKKETNEILKQQIMKSEFTKHKEKNRQLDEFDKLMNERDQFYYYGRGGGGAPLTNMDYGNSNYSRDSNPFLREEQDASSKKLALQSELKFQIEQKEKKKREELEQKRIQDLKDDERMRKQLRDMESEYKKEMNEKKRKEEDRLNAKNQVMKDYKKRMREEGDEKNRGKKRREEMRQKERHQELEKKRIEERDAKLKEQYIKPGPISTSPSLDHDIFKIHQQMNNKHLNIRQQISKLKEKNEGRQDYGFENKSKETFRELERIKAEIVKGAASEKKDRNILYSKFGKSTNDSNLFLKSPKNLLYDQDSNTNILKSQHKNSKKKLKKAGKPSYPNIFPSDATQSPSKAHHPPNINPNLPNKGNNLQDTERQTLLHLSKINKKLEQMNANMKRDFSTSSHIPSLHTTTNAQHAGHTRTQASDALSLYSSPPPIQEFKFKPPLINISESSRLQEIRQFNPSSYIQALNKSKGKDRGGRADGDERDDSILGGIGVEGDGGMGNSIHLEQQPDLLRVNQPDEEVKAKKWKDSDTIVDSNTLFSTKSLQQHTKFVRIGDNKSFIHYDDDSNLDQDSEIE